MEVLRLKNRVFARTISRLPTELFLVLGLVIWQFKEKYSINVHERPLINRSTHGTLKVLVEG